jgi:hypothetical protein
MTTLSLSVTPRLLLRYLLVCFGFLLAMNLLTVIFKTLGHEYVKGFVPLFHFDAEQNIPTVYTVLLFLCASWQCFLAAKVREHRKGTWKMLGFVFIAIAIDEFAVIHERLITPVRDAFSTSGFFYYAWIIPYFFIVVFLFFILFGWLRDLPKDLRAGLLVSAFTYLSGAFVMEGFTGWYFTNFPGASNLSFYLLTTVEESLEILGITIFIYVVSKYLVSSFDRLRIELTRE